MTTELTYNVRMQTIEIYKGKRGRTYTVRWRVNGKRFRKPFSTKRLAESFNARLLTAVREGIAFSTATGEPKTWETKPAETGPTWYRHALATVDMKWNMSSPNHRKGTAEGLTAVTLAMLPEDRPHPAPATARIALQQWAFSLTARTATPEAPHKFAKALHWITQHSRPLTDLNNPSTVREVLTAISVGVDGQPLAESTVARKRAALSTALVYAVELGHLETNPLKRITTKRRGSAVEPLDKRCVLNPTQAATLLAAVREVSPDLEAYFACMYYAALRPGEARNLKRDDLTLPNNGWGEVTLQNTWQDPGGTWTDNGEVHEERGLKHRRANTTRVVPLHPELVTILHQHIKTYTLGNNGRLFVTRTRRGIAVAAPYSRPVRAERTNDAFIEARSRALPPEQHSTPLAARPYDLRHACVSTWLAAGVPPTQVAAWAGHSVAVLLTVYAQIIDGQEHDTKNRIQTYLTNARTP